MTYTPPPDQSTAPARKSVLAYVGLGLAVLALVLAFIPGASLFAGLPGLAALIIGIVALSKKVKPVWASVVAIVLSVVAGIVAVIVTIVSAAALTAGALDAAADAVERDAESTVDAVEPVEASELVAAGQAGTVGGLSYTVTAVECGLDVAGPDFNRIEAAGQFCSVSVDVENVGDEAATLFSDDVSGQIGSSAYEPNSLLTTWGDQAITYELNPGLSVSGEVFIDIPADAELESIRIKPMFDILSDPVGFAIP